MKIKLFLKKFLICLILVVLLFNFLGTPHAEASSVMETINDALGTVLDGIVGILTWIPRATLVGIASAILGVMGGVATTFGYVEYVNGVATYSNTAANGNNITVLGVADIFFNRILLTDVNIFNVDPGINDDQHPLVIMRTQIALWYYVMRIIAISVLLGILIYVAIRMAIATIAADKARYKKMLVDWASSIALVFLLHYLIVIVVNLNDAAVRILSGVGKDLATGDDCFSELAGLCFSPLFSTGVGATIVLAMLVVQTLAFLIFYVKRMLTISFLIIVSPLITITYSIDKMGDGKAQALNAWFKEFVFSIIIQPFHCIIYLAFTNIAIKLIGESGGGISSIAASVLAAMCIQFIWNGEKIIKKIFGIEVSQSMGDAVASAAIAGTMISKATKAGTKVASKGVSTTMKLGGKAGGLLGNTAKAIGNSKYGKKVSNFVKGTKTYGKFDNWKTEKKQSIKDMADRVKKTGIGKAAGKTIKGVKNFAKSDLGQSYKRAIKKYAAGSVGVATGILTMGANYGSSEKSGLITSGIAGAVTGKAAYNATSQLFMRKTEHFEDKVENNQNAIKELTGVEMSASNMGVMADSKDKKGEFNDLKDERKDTKKSLSKKLKSMDPNATDQEIDAKAETAMRAMELGVLNGDLDLDKIAKSLNMNKGDLQSIMKDYGSNFVLSQVASDNKQIDDLAGESGYHNRALAAIDGMKESRTETSSYTEEQIDNATENAIEDFVEDEAYGAHRAHNKGTENEFKKVQDMLNQLMVMIGEGPNNKSKKAEELREIMQNEMNHNIPDISFDASAHSGGDGLDSSYDLKASNIEKAIQTELAGINPSSPTFEADIDSFVDKMVKTGSDGKTVNNVSRLVPEQIEARKKYIQNVTKHTIYKQIIETKLIDLGERQVNP